MANENALKLIFQKKSPASRILAFEHAFAGRSLALSQITDKPQYRAGLPATLCVDYVPFFDAAHPKESTARAVAVLKSHLARFPKQHAAMHMELIIGEGGYLPGDREFFVALMETLKSAGVAIFVDEIQTFGRTTEPFAFQHFGLDAFVDVVTVGKLTQVCATLFSTDYKPQPGLVSQTFTGSTSSIFAARYILDTLLNGGYFGKDGRIARLSTRFVDRLKAIAQRHPDWLRGPFGAGAMVAMTVRDGSEATSKKFLHALFEAGVIGFIAGENPTRVRFLIPFGAVADEDIDAVCAIIERTLEMIASDR
jgi:acetylornithine aminotransferase